MSELQATVRHAAATAIIDLRGDIDGGSEQALNSAYAEATAANPASVLLNFSRASAAATRRSAPRPA